ncbi:unnamed protein product [Linum trigynum]|uniref:Uncharacterized protein n=1 Tax=Linum trigynum TaxID=586398 RepID=A0AAV2DN99_9ROSI
MAAATSSESDSATYQESSVSTSENNFLAPPPLPQAIGEVGACFIVSPGPCVVAASGWFSSSTISSSTNRGFAHIGLAFFFACWVSESPLPLGEDDAVGGRRWPAIRSGRGLAGGGAPGMASLIGGKGALGFFSSRETLRENRS